MNEITFLIEDAIEGGYNARAIGESIYKQGETLDEIRANIRDAVQIHFDEGMASKNIIFHRAGESVITV